MSRPSEENKRPLFPHRSLKRCLKIHFYSNQSEKLFSTCFHFSLFSCENLLCPISQKGKKNLIKVSQKFWFQQEIKAVHGDPHISKGIICLKQNFSDTFLCESMFILLWFSSNFASVLCPLRRFDLFCLENYSQRPLSNWSNFSSCQSEGSICILFELTRGTRWIK